MEHARPSVPERIMVMLSMKSFLGEMLDIVSVQTAASPFSFLSIVFFPLPVWDNYLNQMAAFAEDWGQKFEESLVPEKVIEEEEW